MSYALSHYAASGTTKEQLDKARQRFEAARKEVGTLRITVNVEGAEVLVDGVSVGRAPLADDVFVEAGKRIVEARLIGQVTATKTLDMKKGATEDVKLELVAAVPTATASATVKATASATATAPTATPRSKVPAFVLGGAGIASLIVGAALYGGGEGKKNDVSSTEPRGADGKPLCSKTDPPTGPDAHADCEKVRNSLRDANTLTNTGIALFPIGALALAGAAAYLIWPAAPAAQKKSAWRIVPAVSTSGAGAIWTGSF
jgi:hypothetical protein